MTQEDILRMAREAGLQQRHTTPTEWWCWEGSIERFYTLAAAAEREKVAHWMRSMGYATGQGKTTEDLLDFLGVGIDEGLKAELAAEREAILSILDEHCRSVDVREAVEIIKARSKT